eukprot:6255149-Amphidinium_carterae.1
MNFESTDAGTNCMSRVSSAGESAWHRACSIRGSALALTLLSPAQGQRHMNFRPVRKSHIFMP